MCFSACGSVIFVVQGLSRHRDSTTNLFFVESCAPPRLCPFTRLSTEQGSFALISCRQWIILLIGSVLRSSSAWLTVTRIMTRKVTYACYIRQKRGTGEMMGRR
jgi:hypothetical protein